MRCLVLSGGPWQLEQELSYGGSLNWFLRVLPSFNLVHMVLKRMEILDHCTAGGSRLALVLMKDVENCKGVI